MKLRSFSALLILAAAAHAEPAAPAPTRSGGPIEVDGMAVTVNGRVVTKSQVSFNLAPYYMQLATMFPRRGPEFERQLKIARDKVVDELIDREIILDEFKTMGASLKPQVVDDEINRQIRERYNGSREKMNEDLKKNRLSPNGFRQMTLDRLAVQAMRMQHFSDAPPPLPDEIQKEYNAVKATFRDITKDVVTFQMIFIPRVDAEQPQSTPDTQLAMAEDVAKQIHDGKEFSEMAKTYSKDSFADKGGLRENMPRPELSPAYASILFETEPGKVIGPLEDPQGFSIVKVVKKELGPSEPLSNPKVREMIEQNVRNKKNSGAYQKWIEGKRKRAIINRKL